MAAGEAEEGEAAGHQKQRRRLGGVAAGGEIGLEVVWSGKGVAARTERDLEIRVIDC